MLEKSLSSLVRLGENSPLKEDLNLGVALLATAPSSHFQPHVCLNGIEGVQVLGKIVAKSDTEVCLRPYPNISGDNVWLNVSLTVFLDQICWPTNVASLTPRQTAYVVQHLPDSSRAIVLEQVKRWFLEKVLGDLQKGLATITHQFEDGDPLLADEHRNRVFDIHRSQETGVPHTEWDIAGYELFSSLFFGTCLGPGGFDRLDRLIVEAHNLRRSTAAATVGLLRELASMSR